MKKLFLLLLIFPCLTVCANELTEDYLDIATDYCTYGKYQDALVYINKILEIDPYNSDIKELKNTLLRTTNPDLESYLNTTNKNLQIASQERKNGNRRGQLSALSANDFWSNYFLAEYYRNENDLQNSILYYKKAIDLKPNYSQSYLGLAKAYIECNNFQDAIDVLDKYLTYNKNSDIAYALRAEANLNMNYLSDAQDDIQKAINIEENISYLLIEAKILYYKGDYDKAREELTLLSRNAQTSEIYKYLGLCDYAQSDYPNALLNFDKAIILSEDDKDLISTYNRVKEILENDKKI
jgi:tetratricopeptide (TPR) repeat protein